MRQVQGGKQTEFVNLLPDDFCREKDMKGGLAATFFFVGILWLPRWCLFANRLSAVMCLTDISGWGRSS